MNLDEIKIVLDYGLENLRLGDKRFIHFVKVYYASFPGVPFCGCNDELGIAFNYMESVYLHNIKNPKPKKTMDPNQKFQLKDGGTIPTPYHPSGVLTPDNLTDEIALDLLKSNINYRTSFKTVPNDWEALVEAHPTMIEKVTGKTKQQSVKSKSNDETDSAPTKTKDNK